MDKSVKTPTAADRLAQDVEARNRLEAFRSVFEKTDRIMSGKKNVKVALSEGTSELTKSAAGWTDGETIHLNRSMLGDDIARNGMSSTTVLSIKGVNYHELSHVLWTPRFSDDIVKRIIAESRRAGCSLWWYALNALEDQRIETWFVASYAPSYRYFEALALKFLVTNQRDNSEVHILVYGRKFLPAKVRLAARQAFVAKYGTALADEAEGIIDSYLGVVYPTDTNLAFELARQYHDLLHKMMKASRGAIPSPMTANNDPLGNPDANDRGSEFIKKGTVSSSAQRAARDAAKDFIEKADGEYAGQKTSEDASKSSAPANDGGATDPSQPGDAQGNAKGESTGGGGEVGTGAGVSTGEGDAIHSANGVEGPDQPSVADAVRELENQAREALKEALNDPGLIEDVKGTQAAVKAAANNGKGDVKGRRVDGVSKELRAGQQQAATKVSHVIERLRLDLEPAWNRRQQRGRLNLRRAAFRQPHQVDVFDQWEPGQEEAGGVEVAILVDLSGSMNQHIDQASQVLWVLKRAFDRLDINATVLGFSDGHMVMYDPNERAPKLHYPRFKTFGSTAPRSALAEAAHRLLNSPHTNRVLVVITDGQWGGADSSERIIAGLRKAGVTTALLGLGDAVASYGAHKAEIAKDIDTLKDLPDIVSKIVQSVIKQAVNA